MKMNVNSEKYVNTFIRSYKNSEFLLRLYGIWALAVFVLIGIFGIRPMFMSIRDKLSLIKEMEQVNTGLQENKQQLDLLKNDIYTYSANIGYLNSYMPETPEVQSYILDLIGAMGNHGYIMRNLSQYDSPEVAHAVEINVQAEGSTYPINLVKEIEQLKRITHVNYFTFSSQVLSTRIQYKVTMTLNIYTQPQ